jgi:hypothetical protein
MKTLQQIIDTIKAFPDGCDVYAGDLDNPPLGDTGLSTHDLKALTAKLAAAERLFSETMNIEGNRWSISNNGNPAKLIALRQYDDAGVLLSYTHHDSVFDAYASKWEADDEQR